MNKTLKGFTLIECLIALAILAIASLTMAQIYAGVSRKNTSNHLVNTSLANQMAYVEKYTKSQAVEVKHNGTFDPAAPSGNYVSITRVDTGDKYSYPVDMYVLYSRDSSDAKVPGTKESNYNLRYKYVIGHN